MKDKQVLIRLENYCHLGIFQILNFKFQGAIDWLSIVCILKFGILNLKYFEWRM